MYPGELGFKVFLSCGGRWVTKSLLSYGDYVAVVVVDVFEFFLIKKVELCYYHLFSIL